MTIDLPDDVESSIRAEVQSGHFASAEDLLADAVRSFLGQRRQANEAVTPPVNLEESTPVMPFWERIENVMKDVPEAEWDEIPTDLSDQHDHYIYGLPKRPIS